MRLKPCVTTKCPAAHFAAERETIIEFSFSDGTGGLVSFREGTNGSKIVDVYRVDKGIAVLGGCTSDGERH